MGTIAYSHTDWSTNLKAVDNKNEDRSGEMPAAGRIRPQSTTEIAKPISSEKIENQVLIGIYEKIK